VDPIVARLSPQFDQAAELRRVATDDPTIQAVLARLPNTRSSALVALEFDPETWADREADVFKVAADFATGERTIEVEVNRELGTRRIVRSRADLGLYWFECYLPWIPEAGRADIAAIDTWGAVMELPDLIELAHQAIRVRVPEPWAGAGLEAVEHLVNSPEIASPLLYPNAQIVVVQLGTDEDLNSTFRDSALVQWGERPARVVHFDAGRNLAWLDITPTAQPADSFAWRHNGFEWAHAAVTMSISVDQRHDQITTGARIVQSWMNLDGIVASPTHYPNAWNVVVDASGDPAVKGRLDSGEFRAVSFHARGYEVPTVYPAELVAGAIDPYGGRFDASRDNVSRPT
jgi:hypothetical protein